MKLLMELYQSPTEYLFNLKVSTKAQAIKQWKQDIKIAWDKKCAYCNSCENLTIDHIIPQCKGGQNITSNVLACCHSCNQNKGHTEWEQWYINQIFYNHASHDKISAWHFDANDKQLVTYNPRVKR